MVPSKLLAKLGTWQALFGNNLDYLAGWRSEEVKSRWPEEAVELGAELRDALAGKAEVVVDLWPLQSGESDGTDGALVPGGSGMARHGGGFAPIHPRPTRAGRPTSMNLCGRRWNLRPWGLG
jgi:hypothetical protein